jgi:hypothetical protein
MTSPYAEYHDTLVWQAVAAALADLEASGEIEIKTAPDYAIGYICRELAAKWVVASSALSRQR